MKLSFRKIIILAFNIIYFAGLGYISFTDAEAGMFITISLFALIGYNLYAATIYYYFKVIQKKHPLMEFAFLVLIFLPILVLFYA